MRKVLVVACVIMASATVAMAQNSRYYNTKHEIGVTIGVDAITEIASGIAQLTELAVSSAVSTVVTGGAYTGNYTYGSKSSIPTISVEYYYHVNKVVGLGGFFAFNGTSCDMYCNWYDNINGVNHSEKTGLAKYRNMSIIPTAKFDWLRKKYFGMYSKLGFGASLLHESQKDDDSAGTDFSENTIIPNIQLSLLGMEFGSENIRGMVELGCGEQGLFLAGLKYKF